MDLSHIFSTATLVHAAAITYVIGFLVRDELRLRLLLLLGTFFYVLYYWLHPATPLWDAIVTSVILGAANLYIIAQIILERTTFTLSGKEQALYTAFSTLNPGQFRKILKLGTWQLSFGEEVLTEEDTYLDQFYYVMDGEVEVKKAGQEFPISKRQFLGEIAFILDGKASATVIAPDKTEYMVWKSKDIKKLMAKSPAINNAIIALFSRHLARKLALSHQIRQNPQEGLI